MMLVNNNAEHTDVYLPPCYCCCYLLTLSDSLLAFVSHAHLSLVERIFQAQMIT